MSDISLARRGIERKKRKSTLFRSRYLLVLAIPALIWYIIFCDYPMYGIQIAFKKYNMSAGIWGSQWVGLKYFTKLMKYEDFWNAVRNTLVISISKIAVGFPCPIILALLLNELRSNKLRRPLQTVYTFPHFISWVITYSLFSILLSGEGIINLMRTQGGLKSIGFLSDSKIFFGVLLFTDVWKSVGWSSIIYCAAITNINPEVIEASIVDGANRFQRIWYVILPDISVTIVTLFILAVGGVMNAGFDQIFNFYNPLVYSTSDIIDTYVYRLSFEGTNGFSISTAVGLFKSVINCILLFGADRVAKAFGQPGIY